MDDRGFVISAAYGCAKWKEDEHRWILPKRESLRCPSSGALPASGREVQAYKLNRPSYVQVLLVDVFEIVKIQEALASWDWRK